MKYIYSIQFTGVHFWKKFTFKSRFKDRYFYFNSSTFLFINRAFTLLHKAVFLSLHSLTMFFYAVCVTSRARTRDFGVVVRRSTTEPQEWRRWTQIKQLMGIPGNDYLIKQKGLSKNATTEVLLGLRY